MLYTNFSHLFLEPINWLSLFKFPLKHLPHAHQYPNRTPAFHHWGIRKNIYDGSNIILLTIKCKFSIIDWTRKLYILYFESWVIDHRTYILFLSNRHQSIDEQMENFDRRFIEQTNFLFSSTCFVSTPIQSLSDQRENIFST